MSLCFALHIVNHVSALLHYEAYCKHTFIYRKPIVPKSEFVFFIVMLEHFLEYVFLIVKIW